MRHVFYGLSLFQFLPKTLLKKLYFIFGITDETYSLLTTSPEINRSNAWKIAALNHSYWVIGTIVGALFATLIPPIKGIEFSLTALFVILLIAQIQAMPDLKIIGMAIGACVLAALLLPNYFLVCASALALVFLGIDYAIKQPAKEVV
jgi:4-azaleucine resistance transporter AzlC